LMGIPDNYKVIFMGGGASTQFALIPMNFLTSDGSADYVNTGTWSKKAIAEARRFGGVNVAGETSGDNFNHLPALDDLNLDGKARYLHITSNNTIFGTQFRTFPETGNVPLIADMSSDILSHKIDVSKFAMIYAGAQKNLGPAGVTVIILREDMLEKANEDVPTMLSYKTHVAKDSMFNTPPSGPIYMVEQILEWVKAQGGLDAVEQMNKDKADLLYNEIDADDYYRGAVVISDHRSWMNVTMRLPSEELEKKFIADAAEKGLHGLKGHRSVGGIRASIYNAMPREGVERLVAFMKDFRNAG